MRQTCLLIFVLLIIQLNTTFAVTIPHDERIVLSEKAAVIELEGCNVLSNTFTINLNGELLSPDDYKLDVLTGTIKLLTDYTIPAEISISYQSIEIDIPSYYFKRKMSLDSQDRIDSEQARTFADEKRSRKLDDGSKLRIFGSKSVGVTTGNVSAFELNQTMNIQIEGQLEDNVIVRGVLSDQSRPDIGGVSTTIGEVDKIALTVESEKFQGTIGDISISRNLGQTASLNKTMKGARAIVDFDRYRAEAVAGGIKSKHQTVKLNGREGVLGPYTLRSSSTSESSSILPGTERIWLDGILMERGADTDYVVDYLLGKLTFNPTVTITSRSRIEADFEYLDESYRQNFYIGSLSIGDSTTQGFFAEVGVLRQADSKDNPSRVELTREDIVSLSNSGDSTAVRSGAVPADSGNGNYNLEIQDGDTVYVFVDSLGTLNVMFSYVGSGEGRYVYLGGGEYSWVGDGNGSYEPVVYLQSPKQSDVASLSVALKRDRLSLSASGLLSDYDQNLFSSSDDDNNVGTDIHAEAEVQVLAPEDNAIPSVALALQAARTDAEFHLPGKQYQVDRERLWSLQSDTIDDAATEFDISMLTMSRFVDFDAGVGSYRDHDYAESDRYNLELAVKPIDPLRIEASRIDRTASGSSFESPVRLLENSMAVSFSERKYGLKLGYDGETDTREYLSSGDGQKHDRFSTEIRLFGLTLSGAYEERDRLSGEWSREKDTREAVLTYLGSGGLPESQSELAVTARRVHEFDVDDETKSSQFMASSDYRIGSSTGVFDLAVNLRIGRQSLDRTAENYIRVGEGEGEYRLEDGVYVPDEFGDYIRVEEFITDDQIGVSLSNGLTMRADFAKWSSCPENLAFLSKLNLETTLRTQEEGAEDENPTFSWFIPYLNSFSDRSLLREKYLRQVAKIKLSQKTSLFLSMDEVVRLLPRQSPPQSDYSIAFVERFDISLPGASTVSPEYRFKRVDESSSYSGSARFVEHQFRVPFKWRARRGVELILTPGYLRDDSREGDTQAERWEGSTEGRFSAGENGRLSAHISWYRVYSDQTSIPYQYAGGKRVGDNFDWGITLDIRLSKLISGRINYDGEKLPGLKTRHVTSLTVRARF